MTLDTERDATSRVSDFHTLYVSIFPTGGQLESAEQIRRFELLRLAFFALKLRKLEQRQDQGLNTAKLHQSELEFRRSLLRHVIFQQVLTLTQLDAREQALQIIEACRK